jgi:hypothetical protein
MKSTAKTRGKHLLDTFPIQNGLKQGDALLALLFNLLQNTPSESTKKTQREWNGV